VIANTLGPVLNMVIDVVKGIIQFFRGLITFLVGTFRGDLGQALSGIGTMIDALWDTIFGIFNGAVQTVWGIIKGFVMGIVDWFKWLYDILVGHSIIPDMVMAIIKWIGSLPGRAWSALKDFGSKLVSRAREGFDAFKRSASDRWNAIYRWISAIPQASYNALRMLATKLWTRASEGFTSFWNKAKAVWGTMYRWITAIPQAAFNGLRYLGSKLYSVASSAFTTLFNRAKSIVDGRGGLMTWVAGIPGRIAKALAGVGSAVSGSVKTSWNSAAGWINSYGVGNVNKVTSKFGFNLPYLPKFAGGGVIPGPISRRDNTIIAARTGEGVIVPELVRMMGGARGLAIANRAAKRGDMRALGELGIPGYADGGIIGSIASKVGGWLQRGAGTALSNILAPLPGFIRGAFPGRPFMEDFAAGNVENWRAAASKWGQKQDTAGNGVLGGTGWQNMVAILRRQFPNIVITSTYRPGSITASGNQSYHSMGRAVDMAPSMEYFNWIHSRFGKNTKELIYSPAGGRQIKNGAPYYYSGAVRSMHFNHVHWAYDKGGILPPGYTMAYNGTRKSEYVLTNEDMAILSRLVSTVAGSVLKSGSTGTPGTATVARMAATAASLDARLRSSESSRMETIRRGYGTGRVININGDLVLPNIKSGDDAEAFIRNLEILAGE
jgi:Flp pilus assembly pilin Flp